MTAGNALGMIRILVVDDHPVLRDGIASVVQLQNDMVIVGEAADGLEAIDRFKMLKPDITLMDLQMPGMGGIEAMLEIRKLEAQARIIVLTTYSGDVQAVRALKAGASGYLLKSSLRKELIDTIRAVHAGRRHVPAEVAHEIAVHAADDVLSDREVGVLRLVAAGEANKQIARQLSISEDTVKAHMKNIFAKLGVADRTLAVTVSVKRGIIEL
jgi:DNA-binding NarL/FixJ family response regulator